jgi:hypothetical protein
MDYPVRVKRAPRAQEEPIMEMQNRSVESAMAMQYSFTLPADYDMAIIERRIRDKGPLLDNLPTLRLKAYLTARRDAGQPENLYAPFYLWDEPAGMSDFLTGPSFAAVTNAFGWPQVRAWIVWGARLAPGVRQAKFATREIEPIAPFAPLAALKAAEDEVVAEAIERGALAAIASFDPTSWTRVRFRLWRERPSANERGAAYEVGHVSAPSGDA